MNYRQYTGILSILIWVVSNVYSEILLETINDIQSISQETIEILHGIFTLKSKFSEISNAIEKRMDNFEKHIEKNNRSASDQIASNVQLLAELLDSYHITVQSYMQELLELKTTIEHKVYKQSFKYQQESKRQCEELQKSAEQLHMLVQRRSMEYVDYFAEALALIKEASIDSNHAIIEALRHGINDISQLFSDREVIYADNLKSIQKYQYEQQEQYYHRIVEMITDIKNGISLPLSSSDTKESLSIIAESINDLAEEWRAQLESNTQKEDQSYLGLLARIAEQEVLLNKINKAIMLNESAIENAINRSATQQELSLKIELSQLENELKNIIQAQERYIVGNVEQCCSSICQQMYSMQSILINYLDDIKYFVESYYVELRAKFSAQVNLLDEDIATRMNQISQKMYNIDEAIERNALIIQSQLTKIQADISNEVIQEISDLNTELQISTNTVLSAISQSKTALSSEISSKISNAETTLVYQNNTLYSKLSTIDNSIQNDITNGLRNVEEHLTEQDIAFKSALAIFESDVISTVVTSVSQAFTDLTEQHNALCSKIAVAQVDLTAIAAELDTHTCDMTEQHAAICSKISSMEKRIVDEFALLNRNVSDTGYQVTQAIIASSERIADLIRRSNSALNTAIGYAIKLLTKMYIKIPIPGPA